MMVIGANIGMHNTHLNQFEIKTQIIKLTHFIFN
jgi:hypothetical protein